MSRLHRWYDRQARNYSLNWAIAFTVIFSLITAISFFQFLRYFRDRDPFCLILSPLNFLIGVYGIFHGTQLTHAVVRRLLAQSPTTLTTDN